MEEINEPWILWARELQFLAQAGIAYGKEQLPAEWLAVIPRLDDIEALCDAFAHSLR